MFCLERITAASDPSSVSNLGSDDVAAGIDDGANGFRRGMSSGSEASC